MNVRNVFVKVGVAVGLGITYLVWFVYRLFGGKGLDG